ncbi:uncharacterized protein TNCV_3523371 [Trichonephila clavipes]|nr:uncharacterized protein TNCV_3523371 [Trichonephila clavipes]
MSKKSPFAIQTALKGIGGDPKSVRKLRSGDLLIETASDVQSKSFLIAKTFLDSTLTVTPHKSLNFSRGFISESDFCALQKQKFSKDFLTRVLPRCATIGHPSTDCTLEPKCVNCFQSPPSDSKLCSKWKTEKEIQIIKTNRNITYLEARKQIAPQLSQSYAQVIKLSTATTTTQTDENITKIVCPPLKLLQPLISVPKPIISSSVAAVNKSSTSTQAELVPSTSSVTVTSPSKSQPTISLIDTVSTASDNLSISTASFSSTACSVLETTTTTSNTIPTTSQDTT